MAYASITTKLLLTKQQKKIVDYGIKIQTTMYNFLVVEINPLVQEKIFITRSKKAVGYLEQMLYDAFYEEIIKSGLGLRFVRSVVKRYLQAWENAYNKNMPHNFAPTEHNYNDLQQSLTFCDTGKTLEVYETKDKTSQEVYFSLPRWQGKGSFKGNINPHSAEEMRMKLAEDLTEYFATYSFYEVKNFTVIRRGKKYFISLNCEVEYTEPKKITKGSIGLDWGLVDYFIDSNGKRYNIPKRATRQLQRIKALQRVLSKKQKGSNNYLKVKEKIGNAWYKYNCIKKDFVHKLTCQLCNNYSIICIEDLNIKKLLQKARPTRRQKILHNSFFLFKEILIQKQYKIGNCTVVLVNTYFPSSQLCSHCGANTGKKEVSIRDFTCPYCGTHHDRDTNAAINILNEGKREFAEKQSRKSAAKG